jgi:hypothetical protein
LAVSDRADEDGGETTVEVFAWVEGHGKLSVNQRLAGEWRVVDPRGVSGVSAVGVLSYRKGVECGVGEHFDL